VRRIISDGTDEYVLLVDAAHEHGDRARDDGLRFADEAEAVHFLQRVADDYSEKAELRKAYAAWSVREDLYRLTDEQLLAELAHLIVAGHIGIRQL
jgi:hypothetical protein